MLTLAAAFLLQAGAATGTVPAVPDSAQQREREESAALAALLALPTAQQLWSPEMPHLRFAPARSRYNRIEGLSLAAIGGWQVGAANDAMFVALVRLGVADLVPNGEIEYSRAVGFKRRSIGAHYRLAASNEWGNPLALGASLGALTIGRDDGFYYRSAGVEAKLLDSTSSILQARLFAERHRSARVKNNFSFADAFGNRDFHPNIVADDGDIAGAAGSLTIYRGELATEKRFFGEVRLEAAAGDFDYTRAMFEGVASTPLANLLLASLTISGGTSGGTLPVQRSFFLGGSRSLRGQRAGVMSGNTFWMTQAELGTINVFARPVIFFDAGWAGARDNFSGPGRVGSGAGIGGSFFDGSLRFDLARGLYPSTAWRGSLYLQARM